MREALKRRLRHAIRSLLIRGWFPRTRVRYGSVTGDEAVVVMCLWNRPSRIHDVLRLLDGQAHEPGIRLLLWNNNAADHGLYRHAIREFEAHGALASVELVRSPHNVGSIGRFFLARQEGVSRPHRPFITLDDDQDISPTFVRDALAAYDPRRVVAWWAWAIDGHYWERHRALPGEHVDHVGPGGSVFDVDVVTPPEFFTQIPEPFRFLDDIWLSHWAQRAGYELAALPVEIEFVMDDTNQFHGQGGIKADFYEYLRARR